MPASPDSLPQFALDPEDFHDYCLQATLARQEMIPPLRSIHTADLLWAFTSSLSHAIEIPSRVFGAIGPVYLPGIGKQVGAILKSPTAELFHELWNQWRLQHPDWDATQTMQVPLHFMWCQTAQLRYMREVTRRFRLQSKPVMREWVRSLIEPVDAITASKSSGNKVPSSKAIFDAMDRVLHDTVGRSLYPRPEQTDMIQSYPIEDREQDAIAGAAKAKRRGEAGIIALMRKAGSIVTIKGKNVQVPAIPPLPVLGMQTADGMNAVWQASAREQAIKVLAQTAPGVLGILETALPDAAHAEIRSIYERAAAKKRGGPGVKRQALRPSGDTVSMWGQFETNMSEKNVRDEREDPQQQLEARQDEVYAIQAAERAMRIARKRWGEPGERMLQAMLAGQSRKNIAIAAGVAESTVDKRRETLKKALLG